MINSALSMWGGATSICLKSRVLNTDDQDFIAFPADDNLLEIVSLDYIDANNLVIDYYDSLTNACVGTATGLLASGRSATNTYLLAQRWATGQSIRVYNTLGNTLQTATINYKAEPLNAVPCGLQDVPYAGGNAKVYDGANDYDTANITTISPNNDIEFGCLVYLNKTTGLNYLFDTRDNSQANGIACLVNEGVLGVIQVHTFSSNRNVYVSTSTAFDGAGYYFVQFSQTGTTTVRMWVNGTEYSVNQSESTTVVSAGTTIKIGLSIFITPVSYLDGIIRKMQFIDTLQSDAIRAQAAQAGSYESLVNDARFLLDVDFNKTGVANLTTRANTPVYIMMAIGGAEYVKFVSPH